MPIACSCLSVRCPLWPQSGVGVLALCPYQACVHIIILVVCVCIVCTAVCRFPELACCHGQLPGFTTVTGTCVARDRNGKTFSMDRHAVVPLTPYGDFTRTKLKRLFVAAGTTEDAVGKEALLTVRGLHAHGTLTNCHVHACEASQAPAESECPRSSLACLHSTS